jgi:DNA-3-methyladenine glycosylase
MEGPKLVMPLSHLFYSRNTEVVAFELIGKTLTYHINGSSLEGRIVETEAYFGHNDPASHAHKGRTPRNEVMFGPAGYSYVYFTYGNHYCFNVVTESNGIAGAVLIRALEPIKGARIMAKHRGFGQKTGLPSQIKELTNGPGKLTQAFGITREHSKHDLTKEPLYVTKSALKQDAHTLHIGVSNRIGISRAKSKLLRFYQVGNNFISKG